MKRIYSRIISCFPGEQIPKIHGYKLQTILILLAKGGRGHTEPYHAPVFGKLLSKDATLAIHVHALIPTIGVDRSSPFFAVPVFM